MDSIVLRPIIFPVLFAVGGDLLDMHRWRKLVEGKVTWIDDADAVGSDEPQFPIWRLGGTRRIIANDSESP